MLLASLNGQFGDRQQMNSREIGFQPVRAPHSGAFAHGWSPGSLHHDSLMHAGFRCLPKKGPSRERRSHRAGSRRGEVNAKTQSRKELDDNERLDSLRPCALASLRDILSPAGDRPPSGVCTHHTPARRSRLVTMNSRGIGFQHVCLPTHDRLEAYPTQPPDTRASNLCQRRGHLCIPSCRS